MPNLRQKFTDLNLTGCIKRRIVGYILQKKSELSDVTARGRGSSCSSGLGLEQGHLPLPHYGWEINPYIGHGEAHFTLFGPNMEARSYSLALHGLDTLMRLSESPQYWAMCCLHKHTVTLASNNLCLLLASLGCLMQQLTTVYNK